MSRVFDQTMLSVQYMPIEINSVDEKILKNTHAIAQQNHPERESNRNLGMAPILLLDFDSLSLVFEFCAEDYWKMPLSIAAICKTWREIVITTPRAWSFIDIREVDSIAIIDLFFRRSGQCPLHLFFHHERQFPPLPPIAGRLKCLSIDIMPQTLDNCIFQHLERLTIRNRYVFIDISLVSITQLPSLRHLLCSSVFSERPNNGSNRSHWAISSLQTLDVVSAPDLTWLKVLNCCKDSLVSLKIRHFGEGMLSVHDIALPNLKYLAIHDFVDKPWLSHLRTPNLIAYTQGTRGSRMFHMDLGTVKQLRLNHAPDLLTVPMLRLLQLEDHADEHRLKSLTEQLLPNPTLCPNLTLIDVRSKRDMTNILSRWDEINQHRTQKIVLQIKETGAWTTSIMAELTTNSVIIDNFT